MSDLVSISRFRRALKALPPDRRVHDPMRWYLTQHEHWQGWLRGYLTAGAYNRKGRRDDARYAYNHINCPDMLFWLARAAGVSLTMTRRGLADARKARSLPGQSAAFRRHVPWEVVAAKLWPDRRSKNRT